MTTTITTERTVGSAHVNAPLLSINARWADHVYQVLVDFVTYDDITAFSVHLTPAAATALADQLTAAVDAAEGHWQPEPVDAAS